MNQSDYCAPRCLTPMTLRQFALPKKRLMVMALPDGNRTGEKTPMADERLPGLVTDSFWDISAISGSMWG